LRCVVYWSRSLPFFTRGKDATKGLFLPSLMREDYTLVSWSAIASRCIHLLLSLDAFRVCSCFLRSFGLQNSKPPSPFLVSQLARISLKNFCNPRPPVTLVPSLPFFLLDCRSPFFLFDESLNKVFPTFWTLRHQHLSLLLPDWLNSPVRSSHVLPCPLRNDPC